MDTVTELFNSARQIVVWGSRTNARSRRSIQKAVLDLCAELDRGTAEVITYLNKTKRVKSPETLADRLVGARMELLNTCNEKKICMGLYRLADRFRQLFDPVRLSLNVRTRRQIKRLIETLQRGERGIIDENVQLFADLESWADELDRGRETVDRIHVYIDATVADLRARQRLIRATSRLIIDQM